MKKIFLIFVSTFTLLAGNAIANDKTVDDKAIDSARNPFYVGANLGVTKFYEEKGQNKGTQNIASFNLFAGYQINNNLAIEAGYRDDSSSQFGYYLIAFAELKREIRTISLDLVPSYDLTPRLKLLAIAGVSRFDIYDKSTLDIIYFGKSVDSRSATKYGVNLGAGTEFAITKSFSARIMAKYSKIFGNYSDFGDVTPIHIVNYDFGIKYKF